MLTTLSLRHFRNVAHADVDVPPGGLALVGENGHGKTNVLEALYYFHLLRSFRGARDQDLVQFDAPAFHIAARVTPPDDTPHSALHGTLHGTPGGTHEIAAAFARAGAKKRVVVDGKEVERLSEALGWLPTVMVSPRDAALVDRGPSERRRFLDVVLALTSRRYLQALQGYRSALLRRNAALRGALRRGRDEESVAVWEPALAQHGATLLDERIAWVGRHADAFGTLCRAIGERQDGAMRYETTLPPPAGDTRETLRETLLAALAERRSADLRRGVTHVGPHRDDLTLTLGGRDLRLFGSAGQRRTAAIALRMLEARTLRERTGHEPLLLLDDPFAEMDERRSARILTLLHEERGGQTVLAVPRPGDIPPDLTRLERWRIRDGALSRDG